MYFKSKKIKGKGRGKFLGFPTINLEIPKEFKAKKGIYAAWITIEGKKFKGALHFGPVPTFGEPELSLEVFIIDAKDLNLIESITEVEFELTQWLREIKKFGSEQELIEQIKKDVKTILHLLT